MSSIFELDRPERNFNSPTPGEITLMAGKPNSNNTSLNNTLCSQLKASGFNSVAAYISNNIPSSLNVCKLNSLSLFLSNAGLINDTDTLINLYKDNEALGGWFLTEEINFNNDPLGLPWKTYQQAANRIKEIDSEHPIFIGMNGDWKYDTIGDPYASELTFPNRVRLMEENFIPTFWPYCYFPNLNSSNDNAVDREATFYKNLRYFGYVSAFTGVPFWTFLRCSSLDKYGYHGNIPSVEMLRGLAFASLAYGAKGLYYWGIKNILNNSTAMGNVITVNNEIKTFNDVFYNCEVLDTRHVTNKQYPDGSVKMLQNAIGPLEKVIGYGNDLLISQIFTPPFKNNVGVNYLVIVANPFINNSISQRFQLIFNNYWNIFQLIKAGGNYLIKVMTNYNPVYTLDPGSYLIFKWN